MSIISNKPTHQGKEKLSKRRMNVEEVCTLEVIRGELRQKALARSAREIELP